MNSQLKQAITVLNNGGIIIFPTDTAFGIGCRIDKPEAIKRLFKIKKRSEKQPLPVLVSHIAMAKTYLLPLSEKVQQLMDAYFPGALTIILPAVVEKVPSSILGGGKTLGVRMPDHEMVLSLINGVGVPIVGTSANVHGEKTPYAFEDLDPELVSLVDYVVKGDCFGKQSSTVIDCSVEPWKVVRKGGVVMKNTLFIDTTDNKNISVCLSLYGKKECIDQPLDTRRAQVVLPLIQQLLKKHNLSINEIHSIEVNPGPGSFTGVRVGVAIANTLAYALQIPINGQKVGKLVTPVYTFSSISSIEKN